MGPSAATTMLDVVSYSVMYWYMCRVGSMLVVATVWLTKAAFRRRPLRCLRCGSCCWHTLHPSLVYIAPAVLATCRSHTSRPPEINIQEECEEK